MRTIRETLEYWVSVAEDLASKNDGFLPPVSEIKESGYTGLLMSMHKYPECYSHIKKKQFKRTVEEWVELASKLAEDNGGVLPSQLWLGTNGYRTLLNVMTDYPEIFSYLPKNKRGRPKGKRVSRFS